ncbi:MAG TPA: hypothetical protein VGG92_04070 [Caulobacteraceae bacterium]|jgi:hypothetical protein
MALDPELEAAVTEVSRIAAREPPNLMSHPAFLALSGLCASRYGGANVAFALSNALRTIGLTGATDAAGAGPPPPCEAAEQLDAGFSRSTVRRVHLCPLNLADQLPEFAFGPARVGRYSAEALGHLLAVDRLRRHFPRLDLDLGRLSDLQWLVVEERVEVDPRPEARAMPIFFTDMGRDFGAFEPYAAHYPAVVERTLFFLLLAPWEDWSTMPEVDWRGFKIPWVYSVDDDLAVRPMRPPDSDALAFEPAFAHDAWGEEVEYERPTVLPLDGRQTTALGVASEDAWRTLEAARATPLFQPPVEHFMVRAFQSDGIDELIAHMTAIEAAVGEVGDQRRKYRSQPDPYPNVSASDRVGARVSGLLADPAAAAAYAELFDIRSLYVHGRNGMPTISTQQRVQCRRLARRVTAGLVLEAGRGGERAAVLADLLRRGLA